MQVPKSAESATGKPQPRPLVEPAHQGDGGAVSRGIRCFEKKPATRLDALCRSEYRFARPSRTSNISRHLDARSHDTRPALPRRRFSSPVSIAGSVCRHAIACAASSPPPSIPETSRRIAAVPACAPSRTSPARLKLPVRPDPIAPEVAGVLCPPGTRCFRVFFCATKPAGLAPTPSPSPVRGAIPQGIPALPIATIVETPPRNL